MNWCSYYGEQYGIFLTLKIELSYDPAIPSLHINIYGKKIHAHNVHSSTIYSRQEIDAT